jgi:hypothetical protein
LTPSSRLPAQGEFRIFGDEGVRDRHKNKRGQKNPKRGEQGSGGAAEQVADEGRSSEERSRRDLSDGNRVEQLLVCQPAQALYKIGAQKSNEDITASIEDRADFEKRQEQNRKAERDREACESEIALSGAGRLDSCFSGAEYSRST